MCDMTLIPYLGSKNIMCHPTKFSCLGNTVRRICAPIRTPSSEHTDHKTSNRTERKMNLSLCAINHTKTDIQVEVKLHTFFTLGDMWGEKGYQIQAPAALRQVRNNRTHWTVSWVDPKDDLDVVKKKQIFAPCRKSNPDQPAPPVGMLH